MTARTILKPKGRKTYSIHPDRAHDLARIALDFTKELGRNVGRQDVLDALVGAMTNKDVYDRVKKSLTKVV